eukprot:1156404-Pelagomonas_calceolata.AAC.6
MESTEQKVPPSDAGYITLQQYSQIIKYEGCRFYQTLYLYACLLNKGSRLLYPEQAMCWHGSAAREWRRNGCIAVRDYVGRKCCRKPFCDGFAQWHAEIATFEM